ncbi:MAG TPA: hypothetical protein VLD19_14425, partial [Chitinophagaceae bacterium]|nr:hypothetical protein [Chitinophagaceae bacterium]
INSYYHVVEVLPAKSCVRVSSTAGLGQYDNIMLVQMKGATVSTTNDASYGSVTQLNDAGNYEMGIICGISGDSVFLEQTLLNTYDVTGKVQLVRVPMYASAGIVSTLKPAPWDNSTGTGGVLAIMVINTLTLHANITADTMGFKGGAVKILSGTCGALFSFSNYAYNPQVSTGGGYKGEGIVDVTAANSGGRGPMANGGGGGGDHNNGAGGGGNTSAGGGGGDNLSTTGCHNTFPGLGGLALANTGNKVYLGGGGGHGHSNNTVTAWGGGNGGGIVYIQAGLLAGNNFSVSAAGQDGSANIGDGGSGGGAGGTVIMEVAGYSSNVNINVNGGKGGDVDNLLLSNRSMGPGGGGAGGAIYMIGVLPAVTTSATGGGAGLSYNTAPAGLTGNNGAAAAANGLIADNYTVSRSGAPAGYCTSLLLPVTLLYFDGFKQQDNAYLYWKVAQPALVSFFTIEYSPDGIDWAPVADVPVNGAGQSSFNRLLPLPAEPVNYYRLKITGIDKEVVYSSIARIKNSTGADYLSVYPNPAGPVIGLRSSLRGPQMVQLFGADGKLVWSKTVFLQANTPGISLPALQPGVYILAAGGLKSRLLIR